MPIGFYWRRVSGLFSTKSSDNVSQGLNSDGSFRGNKKKILTKDDLRLIYLEGIIHSQVYQSKCPGPPKKIKSLMIELCKRAGGELHWAKEQPEYDFLLEKKLKKYRRRNKKE